MEKKELRTIKVNRVNEIHYYAKDSEAMETFRVQLSEFLERINSVDICWTCDNPSKENKSGNS